MLLTRVTLMTLPVTDQIIKFSLNFRIFLFIFRLNFSLNSALNKKLGSKPQLNPLVQKQSGLILNLI